MGFLLGLPSLLSNVVGGLFTWLNKKQDVDLEKYKVDGKVDISLINAEVAVTQAQSALLAAGQQYAGTRWMQYFFAYPLGFWWSCLIFDSTIGRHYNLGTFAFKLPAPADSWAGWIIAYLFVHTTITSVFKR